MSRAPAEARKVVKMLENISERFSEDKGRKNAPGEAEVGSSEGLLLLANWIIQLRMLVTNGGKMCVVIRAVECTITSSRK